MAATGINSEDRLVQTTFAAHLKDTLGWNTVYAFNHETFGPGGTLGRKDTTEAVLTRDLRAALVRFNTDLPTGAVDYAVKALTWHYFSRSIVQHTVEPSGRITFG
jgi:type I restriction enzyme R subunit